MEFCTDCRTVEGGFHYAQDDEHEEIPICNECGGEDCMVFYDEDKGTDR